VQRQLSGGKNVLNRIACKKRDHAALMHGGYPAGTTVNWVSAAAVRLLAFDV
jgi:hypothetical protein